MANFTRVTGMIRVKSCPETLKIIKELGVLEGGDAYPSLTPETRVNAGEHDTPYDAPN